MEEHVRTLLLSLGHPVSWGTMGAGNTMPRIVLSRVSGFEDITLDGATGTIRARIQVDCFGDTYLSVRNLSMQVRGLLSGYRGGPITSAILDAIRDRPSADGGDVIQRASLDFAVVYRV